MPEPELVRVELHGTVAVLVLDRPDKLNALSTAVEEALGAAIERDDVRAARAIVIAGAGKAFSSGADVSEFTERDPAAILAYYRASGDVYERVAALPIPTIAAIHGWCLGGGLELALACDLRICDLTARFGLPEVELGIVPSSGGTFRLVRLLGVARARELALFRRRFDAAEALRLGVVAELVPEGGALARALEAARDVAELPPLAVETARRSIDAAAEGSRESSLLVERLAYATLAQTADADEALLAFAERRRPRFTGR